MPKETFETISNPREAGNVVLRPELLGEFQAYAEKKTGTSKAGGPDVGTFGRFCNFAKR